MGRPKGRPKHPERLKAEKAVAQVEKRRAYLDRFNRWKYSLCSVIIGMMLVLIAIFAVIVLK